ncbi:DNA topoisomerase 2-associated protein pat1 [Ancistrocladus abbreviatus]
MQKLPFYVFYNSPTTLSFSSSGSPVSQLDFHPYPSYHYYSPDDMSGSCISDDRTDLKHKLKELETAMLGPDSDIMDSYDSALQLETRVSSSVVGSWGLVIEMIACKDLKGVLIACAKAVSDNDTLMIQWLMDELCQMVSVSGGPIQRLGAYVLEGLVARLASSGSSIYKALKCKEPATADMLSYMHILYEVCPYIKFGYMSANGAIAEAMKDERRVHIIDFRIGQGSQWITLIQAFAARPGGPPSYPHNWN